MKKFFIEKASKAFLGIRSMGLFAPLSYWRSQHDSGIGDLDVLLKVIAFAKKTHISVLSLLPLNIPLYDNCPYANASAYVFDPVYIGLNMMLDDLGFGKKDACFCPEICSLLSSLNEEAALLRRNKKSENRKAGECKYKVFRSVFGKFKKYELKQEGPKIADFLANPVSDPDVTRGSIKTREFKKYCISNQWLADHLLFFILAKEFKTDDFRFWPREIALRVPKVIQDLKQKHKQEILFEAFLQWMLTAQFKFIRTKAGKGEFKVDLMLDQPYAFGNADIWCNPEAFLMDPRTLKREYTQGAPPHQLDIPQHWQFYLPDIQHPASKSLLLERLLFFLQFSDLLRIDHLLGYYRLYYMTEDSNWEMTLEKMGIWNETDKVFKGDLPRKEKRTQIYTLIKKGIKETFPPEAVSRLFDESGDLKHAHVIFAARKQTDQRAYEHSQCGWYSQDSSEHGQKLLYTLLSPNQFTDTDYLEKIIKEKEMFLSPSDSIRVGFFNMGLGEEIISQFMQYAQEQGKSLIFENLGVVPEQITRSLNELGATEFKPLFFGYQHFIGDHTAFWFDRITPNSHVCFSTHDTITIRGWWEGKEKWAKKKYYFKNDEQKQKVINWLVQQDYLTDDLAQQADLDTLGSDLLCSVLNSVTDSNGRDAVIMMSNLFGSGDEGIINMPGHAGFWTARAPVTIEELLDETDEDSQKEYSNIASRAVDLIKFLVQKKERDAFHKQVQWFDPGTPRIIATHPVMGEGSKQLRFEGEDFLVDAAVYGECQSAAVVFDNGRKEAMQEIDVKNGLFSGLKIFRAYIPVDDEMKGVFPFQISLNGNLQPEKGYLIGCARGTDMNPLSAQYGQIKAV
ncbi:4-alpha-glucanotransferase [Desulfonema magnum]|uniref:4-alpha-glucanotransferase n=1 Tax=Desulfonema magnum TaxID=45655 RepID=A0A975BIU1_9BACT|nr:4-alpha-glucanotransferase [Desulfonema magnum]QTA86121.1 Glycoside hydrolase, family 77 [Desulfonema magnum]